MSSSFSSSSNELQKNRHITYWLRCLRTLLPTEYTSNESIRMTLAFFIISALDLLGVLQTRISPAERDQFKDWVYHCQHANGGFRGSPATFFGNRASTENDRWDPPNLAATYFALATLIVLGDDLKRVRMRECLEWLPRLQRADGSFGDVLGEAGVVDGGRDTRFCYCAAGVRWILRGEGGAKSVEGIRDIDVDALVGYINSSEVWLLRTQEGFRVRGMPPDHSPIDLRPRHLWSSLPRSARYANGRLWRMRRDARSSWSCSWTVILCDWRTVFHRSAARLSPTTQGQFVASDGSPSPGGNSAMAGFKTNGI